MVSYIRSDLDFILAQIKIAEEHALFEQSGGTQGRSLFGPDGSIPTYNLSWGLRTVDGTYNNPLHPEWGAADNPFPEHLGTDFRTVMIDHDGNTATPPLPVSYTPGVDNDGPGTAGASDVFDPTVRTISNLLVDQTLGNPSAILTALQRAGIVAPAQQLTVTAAISAAYEPLKPLFNALSSAERANAAAQAAASASPDNVALQEAAAVTAAAVVTAQDNLDAQSGPLMTLLAHSGVELDGPNVVITNTAPDEGLSAPFNSWFTLFGQFFDHGLDLVAKGGNGTVFIPLMPDDPLYVPGGQTNFMVLTRATLAGPGADGVLGTDDDTTRPVNTTTSFVDQNQTYTSHPSHQVFLREYVLSVDTNGDGTLDSHPVATGRLIEGSNGGMATWADLKAQARDILGIDLTDEYVGNLPLLATDPYGNFIPDPETGFPQVVMAGPPSFLASGTPGAPLDLVDFAPDGDDEDILPDVIHLAVQTGHAFLADIAHNAVPEGVRDGDIEIGLDNGDGSATDGFYDNELLDAHFIAGDGRANENIGLTAVHHVFHSEHNRLVEHTKEVVLADAQALLDGGASEAEAVAFLNEWLAVDVTEVPASLAGLIWDGERLFQAAKFGTEMQYQHLVFEEFARKIQPNINVFLVPDGFDVNIDPSIVAEFAHVVYRFGHSMLTESIDRFDPTFTEDHIGLIEGFLNPLQFQNNGGTETVDANIAAGAIIRGMTRQAGNEIDEFVTSALRNNLLGLPLDLATINLARGRDTGVPSLNAARAQFYAATNQDVLLKPYESWVDFAGHLKHEASIINFIAAYGTHNTITSAQTIEGKRDAAFALVFGGDGAPADRLAFLNATGAYAGGTLGGLNNVDLWIGGLAEEIMPFGGMLGSTFNFVFEMQMEKLQNGDRFYYLQRLDGLHLFGEMENNSFAAMIMRNTDATHLPSDVFSTPGFILEVDKSKQYNSDTGVSVPGVAPGQTWTAPSTAAIAALLAGREDGSALVDDVFYNIHNPDVAAAGVDPDVHYALFGRQEGRQPNQFFDAAYYAAQNPDVAAFYATYYPGVVGKFLDHYATFGWKEGRSPSAQFDGARYLAENPDVAAAGMNPLEHFLHFGRYEGRQYYPIGSAAGQTWTTAALEDGTPLVDDMFYNMLNPDVAAAGVDPDLHYALWGRQEGRMPNQFFDAAYYAAQNPGLTGNLLEHYLTIGWTEGKSPSAQFDGARYLAENPDVAAAGMNPLAHFLQFGRHEGRQYYSAPEDVVDTNADPVGSGILTGLVIRDNPATVGTDDNYLEYTGGDHVVLGGTENADIIIGGIGDDTLYGDGGNDQLQGGFGNDIINGGAGDDIILDRGGDDNIKAGAGNDVVHAGPGLDLVMGNDGQDFIFLGTDMGSEVFAGTGNDFIYGNKNAERILGNEGNDWIETGTFDGAPGDNFDEIFAHDGIDGHDVFLGDGGFDEFIGEGGDDIMVGSAGRGKMVGMSGFDWATYKDNPFGVNADLSIPIIFDEAPTLPQNAALDEFESMEGLSGTQFDDILAGTNDVAADRAPLSAGGTTGYLGSALDGEGIAIVSGLQALLGAGVASFTAGDILLGGDGSDQITGRMGDDIIDGDKWLDVQIGVYALDAQGQRIGEPLALHNSMTTLANAMFAGTINPGQLAIVRTIRTANGAGDTDTAVFSDLMANYTITRNADGSVTVTHVTVTDGLESDGVDTLWNIERLRFSDIEIGVNPAPVTGAPVINDTTPTEGQQLTLDTSSIADDNGVRALTFQWQSSANGTTWNNIAGATNASFTPDDNPGTSLGDQAGQQLRVIVSVTDGFGITEQVISSATGPVGANWDATPSLTGNTFNGTAGDDIADGTSAAFLGFVPHDTLNGNGGNDTLSGAGGTDTINGGDGNDNLNGGTGNDTLNGGDGIDTIIVGANDSSRVNLQGNGNDVGEDTIQGFDLSNETLRIVGTNVSNFVHGIDTAIGTAGGVDNGSAGSFTTLTGLVELNQTTNNDWDDSGDIAVTFASPTGDFTEANFEARLQYNLVGTGAANTITTGALDDTIDGGGGNDTLNGGDGNDTLNGGAGDDTMNGGAGNDTFRFQSSADADGDTILDFQPGDRIDLSAIDANSGSIGNGTFTLVTGDGFNAAGALRVVHETRADGDYTVVEGNTDGDTDADFQISIRGNHNLTNTDFNL